MMPFVRRLCLMMCFISLFNSSLLHAQQYQGLSETVKLPAGKQPVKEILKLLQQQGNYRYLYDPAQVETLSINIPKGTLSLSGLLQLLDQQLPLDVELKDNIIAIRNEDRKAAAAAKALTGTLQGKIFNDQNESIPGVTIFAGDNNHVTTSRVDGTYSIQLPEGTYNVRFSHLAFSQSSFNNVVVKGGKVTLKDVMLATSSSNLKGVTVSAAAKRETISALYNKQKNAAGLSDGISAEQIARTPDKNVGEVLKRISGVTTVDNKYVVVRGMSERYNAAMLNGQIMPSTELNRKNFSYDIIPSNIIDNITVYKTITPDMSAEFGGGLVNVETKAIPTENFFTISIGGSINDNTTGKAFNSLEIGSSEYLGKPSSHRNLFGKLDWKSLDDILANTNPSNTTGGGHVLKDPASISNNWKVYQMKAHPSQNYQLSWGHVLNLGKERQLGLIASASYRNTLQTQDIRMGGKDGYMYAPSMINGSDSVLFKGKQYGFSTNTGLLVGIGYSAGKHKISLQSLYLNTLDQQLLMGKGTDGSGIGGSEPLPMIGFYDNVQWTKLWQTQLKGEHAVGGKGIKVQWSGTYVHLDRQRPDNHYLRSPAPGDSLTTSPIMMVGPPQSRGIDGAMRWWTRAYESDLNWDLNTVVPFRFNIGNATVTNTFKAGYAGWYKDRSFYVARAGSGGYDSKVPQPIDYFFNPGHENYSFAFDEFSDNFQRNATLHAAYGMFDHKLAGKLRLVWGVRAEYYDINRINEVLEKSIGEITDHDAYDLSALYNREKNWNLFPSASLTYSLTPKMNFRATYAQSIIRPDLRELSFFSEYDFELGGEYNSSTPIVSSKLKHLDFRYEYYPGPGEILSLSLFYKKIDNPMEIYQANAVNEFTLRNNHQAENRGVEMEIRKSLSFIDVPVIRNLTLYGNGTRLFSRVRKAINPTYVEEPAGSKKMVLKQDIGNWEERPQQGASNYMINGGVYYDVKFISVSLLYNYVSNRLFMPNQNSYMSLYERPVEALDGQIAFHLLKDKMLFRANVGNLLNSYSIIYQNAGDGDMGEGKKHPVKDMLYQEDKDLLFYQAKPGRTYSFTLGYSF